MSSSFSRLISWISALLLQFGFVGFYGFVVREGLLLLFLLLLLASCFLLQQQQAAEICTDRKKQPLLQNWIDCREGEREREFCASCEAGEVLASLKD